MKNNLSILTALFIIISLFAFLDQGNMQNVLINDKNSSILPAKNYCVAPLRKESNPPQTGIIFHPTDNLKQSISEIVNEPAIVTPRTTLWIRNEFIIPEFGNFRIIAQEIKIYLVKQDEIDPTNAAYLIGTEVTNYTYNPSNPDSAPAIVDRNDDGWINFSYTIPDMSTLLSTFGISAGEDVSIYQYYPGGSSNTSAKIENIDEFYFTDNFTLSGFATISAPLDLTNPQSGDSTFRQGGNASTILYADAEDIDVDNVSVSVELRLKSDNSPIVNNTGISGFSYYLRNITTNNPETMTDNQGELRLIVNTNYSTAAEDNYYFLITANFDGTPYFTQNYDESPGSNHHKSTTNFTIQNEMDTVNVNFINATNQNPSLDPPNFNITIVTFQLQANYAYGGVYNPENIPVNATFTVPPSGGVTLSIADGYSNNGSADWALTDSNGFIKFNITAEFPILYQDIVQDIEVFADVQIDLTPQYPPTFGSNNQPHRFMQNSTYPTFPGWIDTESQSISINPDFWVGEIVFSITNDSTIRPGDASLIEFEVQSSIDPSENFYGVPINFTLENSIPGVSLEFAPGYLDYNGSHRFTGPSGLIGVIVVTTLLTTPETTQTITLNVIADFEHDSQARWIGNMNAGTGSLAEFNQTWLTHQDTTLFINSGFTFCDIVFSETNETSHSTANSNDITIRRGDALEVTFKVQEVIGGTGLSDVPVNISLASSYTGVTISILNIVNNPLDRTNYYNTSTLGLITIVLSTSPSTPKSLTIQLNAIADFENDSLDKWHVGDKPLGVSFRSNGSFADTQAPIYVASQHFIGDIFAPAGNNPNATRIGQGESIQIQFDLRLIYSGGGTISPNIDDVNISIEINDTAPSTWHMTVTPAEYQDSASSSAIFIIQTNTTGSSPEDVYYKITATAHFGDAQGLTYNLTHPSVPIGKLAGIWVNGSDPLGLSIEDQLFRLKNIDRIKTFIPLGEVLDPIHSDEGLNLTSNYYEVYRVSTTINLSGTYKDITQDPVVGRSIMISFNYTLKSNPYTQNLISTTTDGEGKFSENVNLPSWTPLQDVTIYAWDTTSPDPQEDREAITNIRVMTTIDLSDYNITNFNGSTVFIGELITGLGTLKDDQGIGINSSELDGNIRIIGWNSTHEVGTQVIGNPTAEGNYSLDYSIPSDYTGDSIYIRLNITMDAQLIHYRINYNQILLNIYQGYQIVPLRFDLPNSSIYDISMSNGSVYVIKGVVNRTLFISGILQDNSSRPLDNKEIKLSWENTTTITTERITTDGIGLFNLSYTFTEWDNMTWEWKFYHILDNGTALADTIIITFVWEVYDTTDPRITVTSPIELITTGILPPNGITMINVTIIDPNNLTDAGYISTGLNYSSIIISINENNYTMTRIPGTNNYTYQWITELLVEKTFRINITASDNATNTFTTINFDFNVDIFDPSATIVVDKINDYVSVTSDGYALIYGTITDSASAINNSGVNGTSISLSIQFSNLTTKDTVPGDQLTIVGTSYSYNWNLFNPDDHSRIEPFNTSEDWKIDISLSDNVGNTFQTVIDVKVDNLNPNLVVTGILNQLTNPNPLIKKIDPQVNNELVINVTFNDIDQTGIQTSTLVYEIVEDVNSQFTVLETIFANDSRVDMTNDSSTLTLDISVLEEGYYFIRATVYDKTSNVQQTQTRTITIGFLAETTTTTPENTTTTETPSGEGGFGSVNLIEFVVFNLLALGGGIGIAALYERFKTMKP